MRRMSIHWDFFKLAVPRPLSPMRRDDHPFAREWIVAAVGMFLEIDHGNLRISILDFQLVGYHHSSRESRNQASAAISSAPFAALEM